MTPEALCRCGHARKHHDAKYADPQCSRCPEDGERMWRHEFVPADEQGGAHLDALDRVLKAHLVLREEWDEPPELGVVYRSPTSVLRLQPWNIRRAVWEAAHPRQFLKFLADKLISDTPENRAIARTQLLPDGSTPLGIYLRWEGFSPPQEQSMEIYRRTEAGGSVPRFKDIPGSREFRMVHAMLFDMTERAAYQVRDDTQQPRIFDATLDGAITGHLMRITVALAPKALRDRS